MAPTRTITPADLIRDLAREIDALPPLSSLIERFVGCVDCAVATATDIGRILERDPTLRDWVLRRANSGFCKLSRPILTVTDACVVLGIEPVTQLVYAACSRDLLHHDLAAYGWTRRGFWLHGLAVGTAAARLARQLGPRSPLSTEGARLAGLVHDAGRILVANRLPISRDGWTGDTTLEHSTVGFDHAMASAAIAAEWALPAKVVEAAAGHHFETPSGSAALVAAADTLMLAWDVGPGTYPRCDRDVPLPELQRLLDPFGLDRQSIVAWCDELPPIVTFLDDMLKVSNRPVPLDIPAAPAKSAHQAQPPARTRSRRHRPRGRTRRRRR